MGKAAAKRVMTTTPVEDELDRSLRVFAAQKQFVGAAVNMGWQLGLSVIIPVIIGVKLDERFNSTPSYTLAALFLATGGVVWVISNTIKQVNKEQAQKDNPSTSLRVKEKKIR